jgi:hypothetical protein
MQTLERSEAKADNLIVKSQEKIKLTTIETIKILRSKIQKAIKIGGIGVAGIYLGANALKPQIAESILSTTYEHSTSKIVQKFVENEKKLTNQEESKYKTYNTSQGEKVKYIEFNNRNQESKINGEGKVLIEFAGIDGRIPIDNDKGFEKTIRIIYDSKQMSPEGIKHQAKNVSQMIKAIFGSKYKISSSSTSFGALFESYVKDVKFENQSTYAPFVGESAVVQEVTKLPIPVSIFHEDKYDNVMKNKNKNLKITIPEYDGLTGGKSQILEAYPQTKVITKSNHTQISLENQDTVRIKSSEKYKLFKEKNDKITKVNKEYQEDIMDMFLNRSGDLLQVADKTNIELEAKFKFKFPNSSLQSKSYSKFLAENTSAKIRNIGLKYLNQHIELSQKADKDVKELNQFYKLAEQAEDYKF